MSEKIPYEIGDVIKVRSVWSRIVQYPIWHYGVVVSDEEIVHFNLDSDFDIEIIKTDLKEFIGNGNDLQKCFLAEENECYSTEEIVERANSQVGTNFGGYNLFKNNCEHFANWCVSGLKISSQIEDLKEIKDNVIDGIVEIKDEIAEKIDDVTDDITDKFDDIKDKIGDAIDKIDDRIDFPWEKQKEQLVVI